MDKNLIKALHIIFDKKYQEENPFLSLQNLLPSSSLLTFRKNQIIIEQNVLVKHLYILLSGQGNVLNSITWATDNNIDIVQSLDILGLVEYLNAVPSYTAYVVALTKCSVFRIPVEQFNQVLQQDVSLCYQTLKVLGRITSENMNRAEVNSVFHPKEMLGHYLFFKAQQSGIPYTYPVTRKEMSEELHINLRTLYRYLDDMKDKDYLIIRHGKIIIDQAHFHHLAKRYADIVL